MIKTVLVPATGSAIDGASYAAALELARPFAAHLDALHVRLDPMEVAVGMTTDGSGGLPVGLLDHLAEDVREREARAQRLFTEFCARENLAVAAFPVAGSTGPSAQWHVETGQETSWTAIYGVASDLIVAARAPDGDRARASLEGMLLDTGRPLLIPSAAPPSVAMTDRIAIAWKPTPQAARVVAAAMPLLARTKEVVVMIVEEAAAGSGGEAERLVRNLAWHGIAATARRLEPDARGAAETLLAAAGAEAGLLVMGGYGHNRLREWVFGGFTQRVLVDAPVPVLIAH